MDVSPAERHGKRRSVGSWELEKIMRCSHRFPHRCSCRVHTVVHTVVTPKTCFAEAQFMRVSLSCGSAMTLLSWSSANISRACRGGAFAKPWLIRVLQSPSLVSTAKEQDRSSSRTACRSLQTGKDFYERTKTCSERRNQRRER